MSVEFDTPANRVVRQFQPKNQFGIDTSLSDLTFLRQLSVQGRLRYNQGAVITIVPPTGETYFLYRVAISNTSNALGTFTLVNDGMTRVSLVLAPPFEALGAGVATSALTIDVMDSLVGNGVKSIVFTQTNGTVTALGWVENTSRIRDVAA